MEYAYAIICLLAAYLFICKAWPYFLYPNYLSPSKIERYPELIALAHTLRASDKLQTARNVYQYMRRTYMGHERVIAPRSLLSIFWIGDFSTRSIFDRTQFLWCHTQNRLYKSLLIGTGLYSEDEIIIEHRYWRSVFIHQWVTLSIENMILTVDPYYDIFSSAIRSTD